MTWLLLALGFGGLAFVSLLILFMMGAHDPQEDGDDHAE